MVNVNVETGVAFGYVSASSLHPDLVNDLQMDGEEVYYAEAVKEAQKEATQEWFNKIEASGVLELDLVGGPDDLWNAVGKHVEANWSGSYWERRFNDNYQPDEPIHEGVKDGVKYRTSWLGGALNVWVFESPHIGRYQQCSPCVPGAGNLDNPDADGILAYDVPADWRDTE